jgi:amidase
MTGPGPGPTADPIPEREPHFASAATLARMLAAGDIGSVELLDHFLERIARLDGPVNAVVALDRDRARARAAEADAATARGESWGPLHGLPMTIKDTFETEGLVTTSGAPELVGYVPSSDAESVTRLKAAGAIVFGKSNTPRYAGDYQTHNEVYGRTNNPYDLDRTVGGSSGGSAAALAAGLAGFELGSDIGGSIRNPAHFCGVFGLKPTWGIVPIRGHIPGPPGSRAGADVGVAGPMGRSAADLHLGLDVLAGPSDEDAVGWRLDLPPARNGGELRGMRVATWFDDPYTPLAHEVRFVLDSAAAALDAAGAKVEPAPVPAGLEELAALWEQLVLPAMTGDLPDEDFARMRGIEDRPFEPDESRAVRSLRAITERHRDWLRANERRHQLRHRFAAFFDDHDVLLAPVLPVPAFPHSDDVPMAQRTFDVDGVERPYSDAFGWVGAFGALLLPAAVAPVGRTSGGLPIGIQVVAPHLGDRTAVAAAGHLESLLGGFRPPRGY